MSEEKIPEEEKELITKEPSAEDHQEEVIVNAIPAPESDVINSKTESAMEVHHHGHVHNEKKWKEYLFQFFMLFLAVFCGFLAEYQLEHIIENKREKQFMESMVKDLQLDTAQFNNIKNIRLSIMRHIDSTIVYYSSHNSNSIPYNILEFSGLGLRSFYQNSGTLDQLKNAGGLRLIRKRNVVDSIEAYDQYIKRMVLRDAFETQTVNDNTKIFQKLVDGRIIMKIYADTTFYHKPAPAKDVPININNEYLGEYLNSLINCRESYESNLNLQNRIKLKAKNLIQLIKEEYHIEQNTSH